jgi:hypothetical protein
MTHRTDTIEVDAATANLLKERAARRGITVAKLVAELADLDSLAGATGSDGLAELERRWGAVVSGEATVDHDEVARWLKTWGSPTFKPWQEQ